MSESKEELSVFMHDQPIENIGIIGHVSNGKSTLVKQLTGVSTQKHSAELIRNITMKLGYANAKIFKCNNEETCKPPSCYKPTSSDCKSLICDSCGKEMQLVRHVSFGDMPGHNLLMATMLNGSCAMDYTILVESLQHQDLPAPQTIEHINATTMTKTPNKLVVLNKLDLVKREDAVKKIEILKNKFKGTIIENSPFIPISGTHGINIDVLCEYISKLTPMQRDLNSQCQMLIVRSFNINKPQSNISKLQGGILGGTILQGILELDSQVIIKPGYYTKNIKYDTDPENSTRWVYKPINAKVISLNSDKTKLKRAIPGGLIGVQLDIDPALTADDGLIGNVVLVNKDNKDEQNMYEVFEGIIAKYELLDSFKDYEFKKNDKLTIHINGATSDCIIKSVKQKKNKSITLELITRPVCAKLNSQFTMSINREGHMNVIGAGIIEKGLICENLVYLS